LVFIICSTFNKRDYHRFGVEILKNRGYEVEIWDITPLLYAHYYRNHIPSDSIEFDKHFLVYEKDHIEKLTSGLSRKDFVVCVLSVEKRTEFIFEHLSEKDIKYGFLLLGQLPRRRNSFINKIFLVCDNPRYAVRIIWSKFFKKKASVDPAHFLIIGGKEAITDGRYPVDKNTKIINAHALDYDRYLEIERGNSFGKKCERYAVFLDECVPFHPDRLRSNRKIYCTSEKYYPPLVRFFSYLEDEMSLKVIIAAHPRSNYSKRSNSFGNREIIFGKTFQLVKHSMFVLTHASTSINFAVLYQKPIIFLSDSAYSNYLRESIKFFASVFEKKPIDLSKHFPSSLKLKEELEINKTLYEEYKSKFIKEPGTPEKPVWDIFADYCDSLLL